MKIPYILSLCFLGSFFLFNHTETINSFYDKYKPLEKVDKSVHIKWVEKLTGGMLDKGEIPALLKQPSKLKIIVLGEEQVESNELKELKQGVSSEGLDEMITVRSEDAYFDLHIKRLNEKEWHLFYLLIDEGDLIFLSLKGDWPLAKIMSFQSEF